MCFCLRSGVAADFAFCLVVLVCLRWCLRSGFAVLLHNLVILGCFGDDCL